MNQSAIPFWIASAVLLAGLYGGWKLWSIQSHPSQEAVGTIEFDRSAAEPLETFELTRSSGQAFRSSELRGEVWVGSFFFTTCPGSCFKLNTNIQMLQTDDALRDVKWVSISVDPVNDTLEALQRYAGDFGADPDRWLFLRGDMKSVRRVGQELLKLPVEYKRHADYGAVMDRAGRVRGVFNINSHRERQRMKEVLSDLLAEPAPQGRAPDSGDPVKEGWPPEPLAILFADQQVRRV